MLRVRMVIIAVLLIFASITSGAPTINTPNVGYLYPAGGQQGTVIEIIAGGQYIRPSTNVHVTGKGVSARIVYSTRPLRNFSGDQRRYLGKRLKDIRKERIIELTPKTTSRSSSSKRAPVKKSPPPKAAPKIPEVKLPAHPLLVDLENKNLRELAHLTGDLLFPKTRLQMNRQLTELILIEVTIDADATPGRREIRLGTKTMFSNPIVFQVGVTKEALELEPNNKNAFQEIPGLPKTIKLPKERSLELPIVLNGQIMPGDVDRFRFRARKGQKLVIESQARSLIPYLADAVPGWFQATMSLYDSKGNEIAFADDYLFSPDPVLFFEVPADGEYELGIHDSIYRGREDFVYRVSISERPFITQMFPLGGKLGSSTFAIVSGWNLPETRLPLDTKAGSDLIRQTSYSKGKDFSNGVSYAVDNLSEITEKESNSSIKNAERIVLPKVINGRIDEPGDVDVFKFSGRKGSKVVAEVYGRILNSPVDSLIRVTDSMGKVIGLNDDHVLMDSFLHKDTVGLVTHHADSYLLAELPRDGTYYVHMSDTQNHGGDAYGYRLRIAAPEPDFVLRCVPSTLSMRAGTIIPVWIHAMRKDGFDGEIDIVLTDAPKGFKIDGGKIPAGSDRVRVTLTAPAKAPIKPFAIQLQGRARVGSKTVSRPVVPSDDVMQAFLFRHLVPTEDLMVIVQKSKYNTPAVEVLGKGPVKIAAGGGAQVRIKTGRSATALKNLELELFEPPEGVTLSNVKVVQGGLAFRLNADKEAIESGFADNLIVEAYLNRVPAATKNNPKPVKQRTFVGFFPAIPVEVVL